MLGPLKRRISGVPAVRAARLLPKASRAHTVALGVLLLLNTSQSFGIAVVTSMVVGAVPGAATGDPEARRRMAILLLVAVALSVLMAFSNAIQGTVQFGLMNRFEHFVDRMVLEATTGPSGIAHLEDPSFMDQVGQARGATWTGMPVHVVQGLMYMVQTRLTGVVAGVILFRILWWAPLVLGVGAFLQFRWFAKEITNIWKPLEAATPEMRRSAYERTLVTTPLTAKEVRVFGLAPWFLERFDSIWRSGMDPLWEERRKLRGEMLRTITVIGIATGIVYAALGYGAVGGSIGLTALALGLQMANRFGEIAGTDDPYVMLKASSTSVVKALELEGSAARSRPYLSGTRTDTAAMPKREIRFTDVRFHYPGTDRPIYAGLDLTIPAGTSLAIVGSNGAGKTTMMKLLARLYDPDSGSITVDGVDLREFDPSAWRRRVSVIFQDFVRYSLPLRENVGFGALHIADDEQALERAARLAGLEEVVAERGWDAVLSKEYSSGTDLSGGQWQRVALARALMASGDGGVLVLDEPTANLDVRAEAELFDRFLEMTHGITTILISHRFSSVRHADRIVVLDGGRVVEDGTHEELFAAGGHYARMFTLQAARFREDAAAEIVEDEIAT